MVGRKMVDKFVSMVIILMLSLTVLPPLMANITYAAEFEAGADPNFLQVSTVMSLDNPVSMFSSASESDYNYVSHVFTVADVIFFSYVDGTMLALYDSSGTLIWNNGGSPLNKGGHAHVAVPQGVYTACGSEKFAVLTGDPITRYVVGYYAMDQNGYGVSTEFYTWVPQIYGHCSFIVFAYHDNTQVTVEDTDTGAIIATFTLNKGQHWRTETLSQKWLHITANHPVSALTCYDQGYLVPSANGRWSGTEFYTYVSDIQNWPEDLTVISYNDDTMVTIRDSDTGSLVWSGELDEGQAHVESFPSGANRFFTITSSKSVTVAVQPWVAMTSNYHQGLYIGDSTGTRLGTDLIGTTLNGGYLYILAYHDNTNVVIYNSRTGELVKSYTLNDGEYVEANPGNGLWRIMSNYPVSAYSGWGQWNAEFAPIEFREVTAVNVEISMDKSLDTLYNAMLYAPGELITITAKVTDVKGNPLYPLDESNFKVSVNGDQASFEKFEKISATDYKIKIKAPNTPGSYSITVKVTTKVGEGRDTESIIVPQRRKALVIGITEYQSPWTRPINPDYPKQAVEVLKKLGFEVDEYIDEDNDDGDVITYDEVSAKIKNFRDNLSPDDVAVIYINTHGSSILGQFSMSYGDDSYFEDLPRWGLFGGTITSQLDDIGSNLDFLWLDTCYSWDYEDEIGELGAGGIIFFGNEGEAREWIGSQEIIYLAISGGCYTATGINENEIPKFESNPDVESVKILSKDEVAGTVDIEVCLKKQRYLERTMDDFNFLLVRYGLEGYLYARDYYPAPEDNRDGMDLTDPLLTHKSPVVYIPKPEELEQISNETFARVDFTTWDSDGDSINDAATISWDANTVLPEEDITIKAVIYDSSNRLVKSYVYGPYTIYGDSPETSSFNFYSTSADTYNIKLMLCDSSMNPVNVAFITDLTLNAGAGGSGGDEEFTDTWFNTSDSDGDGIVDTIKVSWDANTTLAEEEVSVLALVRNRVFKYGPYTIYASQPNEGEIEFYAGDIGTYEIFLCLTDLNSELEDFDFLEVPLEITTFTDNYTDYGLDTNADGKYESLAIDVDIDVTSAGNYILRGSLHDMEGNFLCTATASTYLTEGIKTIQLNFDGQSLYKSEINGPYELRYLALYKDRELIGYKNRPYTTSAYNYTEFQHPLVVLDWNLIAPLEVLLKETFNITINVINPSDHTLTDLQVCLILPSELDTTECETINIGNLEPKQTKEIDWTLKGTNPGYGEIMVNITSPDTQSVSATRGIIITHFPLSVKTDKKTYLTGDNVIITTTTTNENPEVLYIDLLVNLTLEGPGVKEQYSMPIDFISSLETRNFALTWDSTGKPFGIYVVTAKLLENTIVLNETSTSFTLTTVDNIPPTTLLTIGEPKYLDLMGNAYVSSVTPFTLTAEDNPGGTGVASTFYRVYNSTYDTGWLEYSAPFYLTGLSDGEYSIDYYSVDNIGNTEPTNSATVILDNTSPTTTLTIGEPKYISDKTYVTPDTPFTLEAADIGSGVNIITYRIYNSTYDSGWLPYTCPFCLRTLTDGVYTIEFYSIDNLGNIEACNSIQVVLFSWNYVFEDTYGRGTTLKINTIHKFFQFVTPDKDYGIRNATYMYHSGRAIIIRHCDSELRLVTIAVDTKLDFCAAIAWDLQTGKRYYLIDKPGTE